MLEFLDINGERIAFRRAGQGPAVLLIHSLGLDCGLWTRTLEALSDRFAVVALDCRGHGASSNRGGFTVEAVASDARTLMETLGHARFHVVGMSMGGLMAARVAAKAPSSVLCLVLCSAYVSVGAAGPPRIAATRAELANTSMADFGRAYADDTILPTSDAAARRFVAHAIAKMTAGDYLDTIEAILTADITSLLPAIAAPTLVLTGSADRRAPPEKGRELAHAVRNARFEELQGAGHLAVLDAPDIFNSHLRGFLTQGRLGDGATRSTGRHPPR